MQPNQYLILGLVIGTLGVSVAASVLAATTAVVVRSCQTKPHREEKHGLRTFYYMSFHDPEEFRLNIKFAPQDFLDLVKILHKDLKEKNTNMRRAFSPWEK